MQAMRKIPAILFFPLAMLLVCGLGGCNTVAGAGEDLEAAGSAIEDGADKEKSY